MTQSLAIPRVIPNDWKRLDLIVNKIKMRLGSGSSPTFIGITVTGLTASTLIGANASKALESVTVGTGLDYTRPTLSLSHLGIEALTDPGADRILFWDNDASACKWLVPNTLISITGTNLNVDNDLHNYSWANVDATDLKVGSVTQAWDAQLDDIAALAVTNGNFIVGDGTNWVAESGATARTSLGLGTGDSPQFTGIELGHATDTTITRVSAGVIAVEGTIVMLVGGAPTAHTHDGDTLQHDAVNSSAGSFAFTTGGIVTFSESITMSAGKDLTIAGHIIFNTNNSYIGFTDPRITFDDTGNKIDLTGGLTISGNLTMTGNIIIPNNGTIGQSAGPLLTFDDTNNFLEITGCKVGNIVTPLAALHFESSSFPVGKFARTTTATSGISSGYQLITRTSGNMVDGFGGGIILTIEDDTSGEQTAARIYATRDGADNEGALTLKAGTNGDEPFLTIRAGGKVGILVSDPHSALEVAGAISSASLTFSTAGPTDNVDVSGINTLFLDTSSNSITIGGFANGVDGQVLYVIRTSNVNNAIIEHNETGAAQKIYLHKGADETLGTVYGGWIFVCHGGVDWHDCSHAKHVP